MAPMSCQLCNVAKMVVIPAEAGIQKHRNSREYLIPVFAGMTTGRHLIAGALLTRRLNRLDPVSSSVMPDLIRHPQEIKFMIDPALTKNLELDEKGIWTSPEISSVSYPDSTHDYLFSIEENSFWFKHRNKCIPLII